MHVHLLASEDAPCDIWKRCSKPRVIPDLHQPLLIDERSLKRKKDPCHVASVTNVVQTFSSLLRTPTAGKANDTVNRCSGQRCEARACLVNLPSALPINRLKQVS